MTNSAGVRSFGVAAVATTVVVPIGSTVLRRLGLSGLLFLDELLDAV